MATAPVFAATPRILWAAASTANTARDGTGTISDLGAAGSSGTKIYRVILQSTGDPADSIVTLFLHDGTTARLFDEVDLGNPAAASTTVSGFRTSRAYDDLVMPSGWSLRAAITVALTAGVVNVWAMAADL